MSVIMSGDAPRYQAEREGTESLQAELQAAGFIVVPVKGKYGQEEDSLLVVGMDKECGREWAKRYGQESYIYIEGKTYELVFTYTNESLIAKAIKYFKNKPADNFTQIGNGTYFTLAF